MRTILGITTYSVQEVAELLHLTDRTVRNYITSGKLLAQKIGGNWEISEENLKAFLNGTKIG